MKNHFDQGLNIRRLMFSLRPKKVVECGAGNGECTMLLAHMLDNYPFELDVISDKMVPDMDERIEWKVGISYKLLRDYEPGSIDMCIIDTDHNYWTLTQELEAVAGKISEGGLILLHDVETFYHDTGMAMSYWNDAPYPENEIKECAKYGSLGDAMIKFLSVHNDQFRLAYFTPEYSGAAALVKSTITQTRIVMPGSNPEFAKPRKGENP
jgi:hypothetical protein